jgi:NADH:ubiquinone oxidoreductase subunit 5 (subunit L)/multisubunit Na+/H+ antiporter MnhA subunit
VNEEIGENMDIAYLHLVTNHIPIIGIPFAVAILAIGLWKKSEEIISVAFLSFAVIGLLTLAVYFLGQGGEEFIEELPGVTHDSIEEHEEFALFPLVTSLLAAAIAAFGLIRYGGISKLLKRTGSDQEAAVAIPSWITLAVLVLGFVSAVLLGYTARLGGAIRHPEFHGGAVADGTRTGGDPDTGAETEEKDEGGRGRGRNRGER